jgi:hypothetical protein
VTEPNTIKIDDVEYVRRDAAQPAEFRDDEPPYGGVMLVETVTKYFVGEVVAVHPQELVLRDACWVASTGRYHKFLSDGGDDNAEFEPCPEGFAIIGRGSIVNAVPYRHGLIRAAK